MQTRGSLLLFYPTIIGVKKETRVLVLPFCVTTAILVIVYGTYCTLLASFIFNCQTFFSFFHSCIFFFLPLDGRSLAHSVTGGVIKERKKEKRLWKLSSSSAIIQQKQNRRRTNDPEALRKELTESLTLLPLFWRISCVNKHRFYPSTKGRS